MQTALRNVPVSETGPPQGLVNVVGDWLYEEYTKGGGVTSLGMGTEPSATAPIALPPGEERKRILDLFRN